LLGNSTSTPHSNFLLNGKGDDKNDDVVVLDVDKDLLWEMVELLNDLKFEISTYVNRNIDMPKKLYKEVDMKLIFKQLSYE
jgi:hypothetical protein